MKLTLTAKDGGGFTVEYEPPPPMTETRFRAVCRLIALAIGGAVAIAALIFGGVIPFAGALFVALIAGIIAGT